MVGRGIPRQTVREGQRDVVTILIGAIVTIVSKVFEITDADLVAALTTVLMVMCHRAMPDMASKK